VFEQTTIARAPRINEIATPGYLDAERLILDTGRPSTLDFQCMGRIRPASEQLPDFAVESMTAIHSPQRECFQMATFDVNSIRRATASFALNGMRIQVFSQLV